MSLPTHVDTPIDSLNEVSPPLLPSLTQPLVTNLSLQTYDRLNARFATHVTHSVDYRTYNLKQLAYLVKDNEEAIQAAIKRDLDSGSFAVSFSEVGPSLHSRLISS
jgi:hypothetical protein